MDELWVMVQQQQAAMQEQRDEIGYLKVQMEQQRLDKLALSGRMRAMEESGGVEGPRVSRAGLLKAAAVGVAGLAGAGALNTHSVAAAGTDGDVGLGVTNTTGANASANNQTTILAASGMGGGAVFRADAYNGGANTANIDGLQGRGSGSFSGVAGFGGPNGGEGIFGLGGGADGAGVVGVAAGAPNPGADLGVGVYGGGTNGFGVQGVSKSNIGVLASSSSSVDLAAYGTGRLLLLPQRTAGTPTGSFHSRGELVVDSTGVPYACTADGMPGAWQAVGNLRSFPAPHRVFGDGSVIPAGTTTAAIDATAGSGVPVTAKAAYCAVQANAAGVMTLFPDGSTDPGIANWANTGAAGELALFYMLVPLSAAGKFQIHTYLTGQIYVDVWGYLL
ncbi:MAG: hypothetical protein NVS2B16_07330 [Chloroflexota bacterium]